MLCGVVGAGNWVPSALLPALRAQTGCAVVGCAASIAHLALDEARLVTGSALTIDGGVGAA